MTGSTVKDAVQEKPLPADLRQLESEAIGILREAAAEFSRPVLLYSIGKDSSVLLHLALKAFFPAKPPFPVLHIDTTWKFREMIAFRDAAAKRLGVELIVHTNEEGLARGINPFASGSALHTAVMKTEALKQALDRHGFDAAFGGARRDEEKSRAKERIFSIRGAGHSWNPRAQRPELWHLFNTRLRPGETMRVFPLSNWTELDVWRYIEHEGIAVVPLYFAQERPVVRRGGAWIMVDDDRRSRSIPAKSRELRRVRFPHARLLSRCRGRWSPKRRRSPRSSPNCAVQNCRSGRGDSLTATARRRWSAKSARAISDARGFLMPDGVPASPAAKGLLRFLTCGSVDDGKSTLIGRLLHDSAAIHADQMDALKRDSQRFGTTGADLDLSLLLDGLEDERQQRITIDVAYRFFSTPRRSFIVADTPGLSSTR